MIPLILALLLAVAQASTPIPGKVSDSASGAAHSITKNTQEKKAPSTPSRSSAIKPIAAPPQQRANITAKAINEDQPVTIGKLPSVSIDRSWADWVLWAFNGLLVLAGFLGILVAYRTLCKISEQTQHIKTSAEAARDSAKALLSQNRPWMLLGNETTVPESPPQNWKFKVFVRNYGKTPARIMWMQIESQTGTSNETPPDERVYQKPAYSHPFILPPEGFLEQAYGLPQPWDSQEIEKGQKFLWLCGYIIYSEATERGDAVPYETTFCLVYDKGWATLKPHWGRSGPKEYNRAT